MNKNKYKCNYKRKWYGCSMAVLLGLLAGSLPVHGELLIDEGPAVEEEAGTYPESAAQAPQGDGAGGASDSDSEGELIEGNSTTSKQEGVSLEEIEEAERRAEEALAAAEGLMSGELPMIASADEAQLQTYLDGLYQVESPTGSDGELRIASYIGETMKALGYTVSEQDFHEGFLNEEMRDVPGVNVLAERGADSERATKKILIVAAHYDSKTKTAEDDPLANDKTGAAAVMETARILAQIPSDIDLCFAFLSGEEDGLYGSAKLTDFLTEEQRDRVCGVIYVGTVGTESSAPVLLGADAPEGNEPARLIRAVALEKELTRILTTSYEESDMDGSAVTEISDLEIAASETSALDSSASGVLEDWTFVTDRWSSRRHFSEIELPVVSLFQDVLGYYKDGTEPFIPAPQQDGSGQSGQNEQLPGEADTYIEEYDTEYAAVLHFADGESEGQPAEGQTEILPKSENANSPVIDMRKLQEITDVLAETILRYMYMETVS